MKYVESQWVLTHISKKLYNWEIDTFAITSEGLVLIATLNGLVEIGSTLA